MHYSSLGKEGEFQKLAEDGPVIRLMPVMPVATETGYGPREVLTWLLLATVLQSIPCAQNALFASVRYGQICGVHGDYVGWRTERCLKELKNRIGLADSFPLKTFSELGAREK